MDNVENVENTSKAVRLCDDLINGCYEGLVSSPVELTSRVAEIKAAIVDELDHFREAAKMVGNNSAMRGALVRALEYCESDQRSGIAYSDNDVLVPMLREALAEPPRNCDVGTAGDQMARFNSFCDQRSCDECELPNNGCRLTWAQMPYKSEGDEG